MALKNVTKISATHHGLSSWSLIDDEGDHVLGFEYFVTNMAKQGFKFPTRKRYGEVVSKFIDYLYEVGAFTDGVTEGKLNTVIDMYPTILAKGKGYDWVKFIKESKNPHLEVDYEWIPNVVSNLDIPVNGLKANSFDNTIAAINKFLRICETFRYEQIEKAQHLGLKTIPSQLNPLIKAVSGSRLLSKIEKKKIKQASVLGSVMRSNGEGMSRPSGLKKPFSNNSLVDIQRLDFPIKEMNKVIDASRSHRDKALWLLSIGAGLRSSEVKNLCWGDIDIEDQKVWVIDPEGRRYGNQMTKEEKLRFKGRKYSATYIIMYFRDQFFYELEMYFKHEYTGSAKKSDYVFQYIYGKERGKPLVNITDSAYIRLFKRAVERAGVATPKALSDFSWTPHSLRHAYAVFMINYIPLANGIKINSIPASQCENPIFL